jgi:hypothetical protein
MLVGLRKPDRLAKTMRSGMVRQPATEGPPGKRLARPIYEAEFVKQAVLIFLARTLSAPRLAWLK